MPTEQNSPVSRRKLGIFALLAGICIGGPVSTAIREYALIFYGGRYKALGDILYPPTQPPAMVGR